MDGYPGAAPDAGAPPERWRAAQGLRAERQARSVRSVRARASLGPGYLLNWDLDVNASEKPDVYIWAVHRPQRPGFLRSGYRGRLPAGSEGRSSDRERQVCAR